MLIKTKIPISIIIIIWLLLFSGLSNLLFSYGLCIEYNHLVSGEYCPNVSKSVSPEIQLQYCWTMKDASSLLSLCILTFIEAVALLFVSYGIRYFQKRALYVFTATMVVIAPLGFYFYYALFHSPFPNFQISLIIKFLILIYLWSISKKFKLNESIELARVNKYEPKKSANVILITTIVLLVSLFEYIAFSQKNMYQPIQSPLLVTPACCQNADVKSPAPTSTSQTTSSEAINIDIDNIAPANLANKDQYIKFKDDVLDIEFDYPKDWGVISGQLEGMTEDGRYAYNFTFNGEAGASALGYGRITAGGRSKKYWAARGSYVADYSGFDGQSANKICASFNAAMCAEINQKIVSMVVAPKYSDICIPNPGQYPFSKVVAIDLPANQKINGLVFEYIFLSDALYKEIYYDILGAQFERCYLPDPETEKIFDKKIQETLKKINIKALDQQTLQNIEKFDYFVNSIKFYE